MENDSIIEYIKKVYDEEKLRNDRLRISVIMTNGKEHTGTSIVKAEGGAWVMQSGSDKVILNPAAISSAKTIAG